MMTVVVVASFAFNGKRKHIETVRLCVCVFCVAMWNYVSFNPGCGDEPPKFSSSSSSSPFLICGWWKIHIYTGMKYTQEINSQITSHTNTEKWRGNNTNRVDKASTRIIHLKRQKTFAFNIRSEIATHPRGYMFKKPFAKFRYELMNLIHWCAHH